jgi:hypothetical protein
MLTAELNETDAIAEAEADQNRARPHRWTQQEAREAARLSRKSRATPRQSEPPSDAEIERGLRERAVSDPRAAEILLRWLARPRPSDEGEGELAGLTTTQLEALHASLIQLSMRDPEEQARIVQALLDAPFTRMCPRGQDGQGRQEGWHPRAR